MFSCLLAKSLMHFKCVSKFYNTIVLEPYFVDIRSSNYSKINRVIECLGGVFYSIEEDGNATKSYQLDNFDKLCHHFDRVSNCFDYDNGFSLTIYKRNHLELSRAWVFTLGIDNSWREIITYGEHDYYIYDLGHGDCVISGIIYRFSDSPEFCIVVFDIKSEIFTTITISIEFHNSLDIYNFDEFGHKDYMLIDVNGKLGIIYIPEKHEDDIKLDPFCICKYGDEEIVFALWIKSSDVLAYFFNHVKNKSWIYFKAEEYAGIKSIFSYS
ncbi:hypothetical protein R3W88_014489 [Solanum pinnatisectum]|uniref:F-box associated beta-propeller type 3 domain-containing protein n=1 Tax=Solanum pinnatisectum TaxID=50273 RepID=A0AAV9KS70_9SOLN|nr:hypothetical protein R3W88_014489 [Solanum pinnatisectum]